MTIKDLGLLQAPLAVVDVETTGFTPGRDRVVEICVLRIEPGAGTARRVFDTLVHPHRKNWHTHIHGISREDTADAPDFAALARRLWDALEGAVLVAHNAAFDIRFLTAEFENLEVDFSPPHICTRSLPAVMGLTAEGPSLEQLCKNFGIPLQGHHVAREDCQATAMAVFMMRNMLLQRGIGTFSALAAASVGGWNTFFDSFEFDMLGPPPRGLVPSAVKPLRPRVLGEDGLHVLHAEIALMMEADEEANIRQEDYVSALLEAISDYQISRSQFARLERLQRTSGLIPAQIRAAHAQVFAWALSDYAKDDFLDEQERHRLTMLYECLMNLGWAPGQ